MSTCIWQETANRYRDVPISSAIEFSDVQSHDCWIDGAGYTYNTTVGKVCFRMDQLVMRKPRDSRLSIES